VFAGLEAGAPMGSKVFAFRSNPAGEAVPKAPLTWRERVLASRHLSASRSISMLEEFLEVEGRQGQSRKFIAGLLAPRDREHEMYSSSVVSGFEWHPGEEGFASSIRSHGCAARKERHYLLSPHRRSQRRVVDIDT